MAMIQCLLLWLVIDNNQILFVGANLNNGAKSENSFNTTTADDIILEPINGTKDFKFSRKSKENKSWFDGREMTLTHCVREAKCEILKYKTCLGSKLPYNSTSLHLTYSYTQEQVYERLERYSVLKHIPKCWAIIQPYLCAMFVPKCEEIRNKEMVYLPSLEMCRNVMEPCKLVYNTSFFPEFLKCNSSSLPTKCDNNVREMKFNTSGQCFPPLVHTDVSFHFYDGMSGCGLPCRDPLYTEDEHHQIRRLILWGATINLSLSLFAVITFIIDWKSASKYPALVIFYINVCCVISSFGWLFQFFFDSPSDIVCSKDGTRRRSEPSAGENLSCVVIFILVYYFQIAQCVWFVIFTYAWDLSFKRLGKIEERIDKKGAYFHLVAWSLPLVLTITTMALGEIDGSSITGICFVGYLNHAMRAGLLLGPLLVFLLIGEYFLSHCILTLVSVRTSSKDIISVRASSKIRATIMRCSFTAVLKLVFVGATFVCHFYEFSNSQSWYDSFRSFLICRLTSLYIGNEPNECLQSSRPSVAILQLQLLCLYCSMVLMASWVWTDATLQTWKRYIRTKFGLEVEEPVKRQKHKIIAQAFARRKEFHNQGRMSISFNNTHTDPLGFKFELNSVASHDFSSTWANNLPRFVKRRGAVTAMQQSHSQSSNAPRRNSQDSQISFSLRHVSVESRRNSLDSQVSIKVAEVKTKVASRRRVKSHKPSRRRIPRNNTLCARKESTTSIESRITKTMYTAKERKYLSDSLNENATITGLNKKQIDMLLADDKFCKMRQFFETRGLSATSDDENCSTTSLKIRDSQFNIILHQKDINPSSDEAGANSSTNGLALAQYHSDSDFTNENNDRKCVQYKNNNMKFDENEKIKAICGKEYFLDICGSKSSSKSKSSRRSSRQSGRLKTKRPLKNNLKTKTSLKSRDDKRLKKNSFSPMNNTMSKSSFGSSFDSFTELGRLGVQSSYSGVSVGKNNSRNSKTSCDVGIQANSHEIATQTLSSRDGDSPKKIKFNVLKSQNSSAPYGSVSIKSGTSYKNVNKSKGKNNHNDFAVFYKNDIDPVDKSKHCESVNTLNKNSNLKSNQDEANEPLLGGKNNVDKPIIVKKRNDLSMNESKILKQLLLPSSK